VAPPKPPPPTPTPPPGDAQLTTPGDLVLPGRPVTTRDAGAADAATSTATLEETLADLRARIAAGGAAGDQAAAALASRTEAPAIEVLRELVTDPGVEGGVALGAVLARRERHHMPVLEAALFGATQPRQLAVVKALEDRRNVEALTLLQRAAREHGDAVVRDAAARASRSIFSVEGE
jgi:hypothetical protein